MSKNRGWLNKMKVDDGMLAGYFNVRKEFLMKWKDINIISEVKRSGQRAYSSQSSRAAFSLPPLSVM